MRTKSESRFAFWSTIGIGMFLVLFSFGLLYFGLGMLSRALDRGYTILPALGMLVSWIVTLLIGVLVLRLGRKAQQNLRRKEFDERSQT